MRLRSIYLENFRSYNKLRLNINKSNFVILTGKNGTGKTNLLEALSFLAPGKGFRNSKLDDILKKGITIHNPNAVYYIPDYLFQSYDKLKKDKEEADKIQKEKTLDEIYIIFPILADRSNQLAHTMSGGEQQMLAIARGLMGIPKLLMVDEPFLGLSPKMIEKIKEIFYEIVSKGIAILFVEQNVKLALNMADRGYVLESGHLVIEGKSDYLLSSEKLKKVFLG